MQPEAERVVSTVDALLAQLKSCRMRGDLHWGRRIHAQAVDSGNESNKYLTVALIRMYAKCGSMVEARRVFDSIQDPNVLCWTALLLGYADTGEGYIALELFYEMKARGCAPDSVTYVAVLKACTSLAVSGDCRLCLHVGRNIHSEIGWDSHIYVQNTLIDMYAKCGNMSDAHRVFDSVQRPTLVSWTALLLGYAENGESHIALQLFSKLKKRGFAPNAVTYVAVLKACTALALNGEKAYGLETGRNIHLEMGCSFDLHLQNTLLDMYAKCGSMSDARSVFDSIQKPDVVSWTALLLGYAENGEGHIALELFSKMKTCGCLPNSVTYVALLKACTSLAQNGRKAEAVKVGRRIHSEIGSHLQLNVENTLIDMYAKCGSMADARLVFGSIKKPDIVSWNALLSGYVENGEGFLALNLFSTMKAAQGCAPDSVTYVAVLKACSYLAVNGEVGRGLETGRSIHSEIGWPLEQNVQNILVDMYAKCGSIPEARTVFETIQKPDVVSWNALLLGYAENGEEHVALDLFFRMTRSQICRPNSVTYIAVLKACGSIGALALGRKFHSELREFSAHTVTCLVDFYAKCGSMAEARAVFDQHSATRSVSTWNALLAGYSTYGDTALVLRLFEVMQVEKFRPDALTFLCILLCCSHAGLVDKAMEYLKGMPFYGVTPTVMHYTCVVDACGRANKLNEAISVLERLPCDPDAVIWMAVLGACDRWKNVEIGRKAFEALMNIDKGNACAYVLMARIYGSLAMWEEQTRVLKSRTKCGGAWTTLDSLEQANILWR